MGLQKTILPSLTGEVAFAKGKRRRGCPCLYHFNLLTLPCADDFVNIARDFLLTKTAPFRIIRVRKGEQWRSPTRFT